VGLPTPPGGGDMQPGAGLVDVVDRGRTPEGWLEVVEAHGTGGRPVTLVHADHPDLRRMCLFDAVVNNADRKGGHVILDADDRIWCIDHGVSFNVDEKLRTVLWGWAGEPIDDDVVADLVALEPRLPGVLDPWLSQEEVQATARRLRTLIESRTMPHPSPEWPAVPWPVF